MTPPVPTPSLPRWINDIATSLMMGAGAIYVQQGVVSSSQETAIIGGVLALASVAYGYLASHSSHQNPIAVIRSIIGRAPPPQQAAYDAAVAQGEAWLIATLTPIIHAQVKAHVGALLAGPIDGVADKALKQAADKAVAAIEIPHMSVG